MEYFTYVAHKLNADGTLSHKELLDSPLELEVFMHSKRARDCDDLHVVRSDGKGLTYHRDPQDWFVVSSHFFVMTLTAQTPEKLAQWTGIMQENIEVFLGLKDTWKLASVLGISLDDQLLGVGWCPGHKDLSNGPGKAKHFAHLVINRKM